MLKASDLIAIEDMKLHLRLDHDDEDSLVLIYAQAALEWCLWYCDSPGIERSDAVHVPNSFKCAVLLVMGDLFASREANAVAARYENPTAANLLWMSRDWQNEKQPRQEGS